MVNRTKKTRVSSESESEDQQGSSSGSEDSASVPEVPIALGRKRRRGTLDHTESDSDSEETTAVPLRRRRRSQRGRVDSEEPEPEPEGTTLVLRGTSVENESDSEESGEGREAAERHGRGERRDKRTRRNGKVMEAIWTPEKTVKITYDIGVKHACMNPIHGKAKQLYKVLHLVKCPWPNNVRMMTDVPPIDRSKLFQYCHKLCEACLTKYGARCFKCEPVEGDVNPILRTVFGSDAITCAEDFRDAVRRWQDVGDEADASYTVLHCTVIGPEARLLRRRFSLKRSTVVHIVYSDVRDKMEPAGSGTNLEESEFQHVWKAIMKEKVPAQNFSMVSFYGNILLNETLSFEDFRLNDLLVMYEPNIFNSFEENAIRVSVNSLHMQSLPFDQPGPSECCLQSAVVHVHREPTSREDDCTLQHGNLVASLFYKGIKRYFGRKIVSEFEQRAGLGEALRIGDEGQKLPFRKLYAARGGEVRFRRNMNATQGAARRDARSRICGWDTSGFELVCWTQRGHPVGGDFVIPGLMYRFETNSGSSLIFRPTRYFHATLPTSNRDLKNEKFAAAFVTPT